MLILCGTPDFTPFGEFMLSPINYTVEPVNKGVASSKNRWCPVGTLSNQLGVWRCKPTRKKIGFQPVLVASECYLWIISTDCQPCIELIFFLQLFNYHTYFIHPLEVLYIEGGGGGGGEVYNIKFLKK